MKCTRCQAERPITSYSESQIARLRKKLATQGQVALTQHAARCLHCTGGIMPPEIECSRCRKTKPLNAFTKTQRADWDLATCKTCTAYYMTSETWEEERENAIAMGIPDGYTEIASTIGESVDGGVRLESLESFSIASKSTSRICLRLEDNGQLGRGIWLEDSSVNGTEDGDDDSVNDAPSSAAKFSGWDFPALRAEASRPSSANSAEGNRKRWAKVKSADPNRNARILKMSDPMHHLNDEEDKERAEAVSLRAMVGTRDRSKLNQKIRADEVEVTIDDDASIVKARDS
ncbi:conserved hypothetical protein [Talaromyces marneffei ATCC 18224]|uniref:Stc1 domain-containing protein n=3 Tax=Talaromyces marneffei TaxID=37727 RepID=B6QC22_TALMQ|nr:conserved hypothetical protein [Talaromyces marneffei ATCC 18224]